MKTLKLLALTSVVFVFFFLFQGDLRASAEENVRILVKYKDKDEIKTQSNQKNPVKDIEIVETTKEKAKNKIQELEQDPEVEYAEIDQLVYTQGIPNDPGYSFQSSFFDVLKVNEAWLKYSPSQKVTVAVIDSGVDLDHPDLKGALVGGTNIVNSSLPPTDNNGHGTHVAGLVGALTDNHVGVSSIAKQVKIMPVKVLDGESGYTSDVIKGIYYAVDHGANILNLSLGNYMNTQALQDAIAYAESKNVLVVAAAGNDGVNRVMYPAAYKGVIAVGSVNTNNLTRASFSNYGSYVDVYVPGTNLYSTYINDGYISMDGTSMSTGVVSSIAAMLKQQAPFLTAHQIQKIIDESAVPAINGQEEVVDSAKALQYIETYQRLSGATSMETAIEISKSGWPTLPAKTLTVKGKAHNGTFAILATSDTFPDSLVASPLASYLDSPILLVKNHKVTEALTLELNRLKPTYVVIIGGPNAVSSNVESQIQKLGIQTVRLFGNTRYETAIAVNEVIPYSTNKAFVVSGENYPDALSIASYSGNLQYPLLFTRSTSLPSEVKSYIGAKGITNAYVVGGTVAISKTVENQLPSPIRISGIDRFETNYIVQKTFGKFALDAPLYYATGFNFPDALAVGPLAALNGSPVILVNKFDSRVLKYSTNLFDSTNYYILGGKEAISIQKAWEIDTYVTN